MSKRDKQSISKFIIVSLRRDKKQFYFSDNIPGQRVTAASNFNLPETNKRYSIKPETLDNGQQTQ